MGSAVVPAQALGQLQHREALINAATKFNVYEKAGVLRSLEAELEAPLVGEGGKEGTVGDDLRRREDLLERVVNRAELTLLILC